jgi:hypothetical protein
MSPEREVSQLKVSRLEPHGKKYRNTGAMPSGRIRGRHSSPSSPISPLGDILGQ